MHTLSFNSCKRLGAVLALAFTAMACGSSGSEDSLVSAEDTLSAQVSNAKISDDVIGDLIKSMPSPLEVSMLIKNSGGKYKKDFLNNPDNAANYNNSYKQALNLGVYGTDLGYISIYEETKDALNYLNAIRGLADNMGIGQFYDYETIKRLATNSENIDSLLLITTQNFESINDFLHQKKRSSQSVLLLTGGWLEALHITCQVAKEAKNDKLYEKIGEQKVPFENILIMVDNYNGDPKVKEFHNDLLELKALYDKIEIVYIHKEPKSEVVDGVLMIVDQSSTQIKITEAQVIEISNKVAAIRAKIIA